MIIKVDVILKTLNKTDKGVKIGLEFVRQDIKHAIEFDTSTDDEGNVLLSVVSSVHIIDALKELHSVCRTAYFRTQQAAIQTQVLEQLQIMLSQRLYNIVQGNQLGTLTIRTN